MTIENVKKIRLLDNIREVGLFHKLPIFENGYELEAKPTDLVVLSGGVCDELGYTPYWTSTSGRDHVAVITSTEYTDDRHYSCKKEALQPCIRPVLEIENVPKEKEITFGEYPQFIETDEDIIIELESIARRKKLSCLTGKKYALNNKLCVEYAYKDSKYVAYESKTDGELLSNGTHTQRGKIYFIKVAPLTWIVDRESKLLISKYGLLSGVSYWGSKENDKFENSNMYEFLTEKMYDDICNVSEIRKINDFNAYLSANPFNLSVSELTDNERIQKLIVSGVSPFLHGQTGVGKSARVRQEDENVTPIYLCNETLDSLNGKTVYVPPLTKRVEVKVKKEENGKIIDRIEYQDQIIREGYMMDVKPAWLEKIEKKCAAEPDKLHIVFFDEITNAPPAIQGYCFNIILDYEVNGIWKLPPNARVVAAGNEIDDSIAANELAEPLFSRFAHIYIDDNVKSWLNWAIKEKIHPAIIAFIAFSNGNNLRTKYNGKTPNADPRKWEMASKVLYETKNISLLEGLIGRDLTKSFKEFCKCETISLEDVISGNYTDYDLKMDANKKFVTAMSLSSVGIDDFEKVYDFMMKVGPEPCAVFESLWVGDSEEKAEKLMEVKMKYREQREAEVRNLLLDEKTTRDEISKAVEEHKKLVKKK